MRKGYLKLQAGGKSHLLQVSLPFLRPKPGAEQENTGLVLLAQLPQVVGCWGGDLGIRAWGTGPSRWRLWHGP